MRTEDYSIRSAGDRLLAPMSSMLVQSPTFTPARGGRGTHVSVNLQYEPPAGRAGALLATIAGREPSQTIREDLRRMKDLLEAGEIRRASSDSAT